MNILIAPLNWGLGHAARCIPLVNRYLREGHHVTLAGDGNALRLLQDHFPHLPVLPLPALNLRYSRTNRQVGAMLLAFPKIVCWSVHDHRALNRLLRAQCFDLVISDNRFGLFSSRTKCVYITHQLHIMLPQPWRWLEPLAERLHARIIRHYDECWVPDYADEPNLSGSLSHIRTSLPVRFIGPLSRFENSPSTPLLEQERPGEVAPCPALPSEQWQVVAVLSGLEPQRTLFEQAIIREFSSRSERVLIVQGLLNDVTSSTHPASNITLVPSLPDTQLAAVLQTADLIIARSGYSTIMDLHALHLLHKARLVPTPGQPEQEYLASHINNLPERASIY